MRWIFVVSLLLPSLAQAEILPEKLITILASKVKAACLRAPVSTDFGKETQEEACLCSERNYAAKVRVTEFSSASQPNDEDRTRIRALEEKAVAECVIPYIQRNVEKNALADCLSDPKSFKPLQNHPDAQAKAVCACTADRYSKAVNYLDPALSKDKNAEAKMGALFISTMEACASNPP